MSLHPPIIYKPEFISDPDRAFKALKEELAWARRDMSQSSSR
jgi:hypothetical protein